MSLNGVQTMYSSWGHDKGFLKMVAALDMFLYKFKSHEDSILRMGSLVSRFKDCTALLSFGYAMSILNIEAGALMDWVFIKTMADEILRLSKSGQESGSSNSYFPYQSDLGLISKSAYSSNANSYLFTWIHMIGSLLGHRRSQNARLIFEGSFSDVGLNAVMVVWAFARGGELTPQFDHAGTDYGANIDPASDDESEDEERDATWRLTTGRDPKTWFVLLKTESFSVPKPVRSAITRQINRIDEVREGTIGYHVKTRFVY